MHFLQSASLSTIMLWCFTTAVLIQISWSSRHTCTVTADTHYRGSYADCSRRNLTSIPGDLPANTTSLDASNNNISDIQLPKAMIHLKYLDLSFNSITRLGNSTFQHVPNLSILSLNDNKLLLDYTRYPDDVFKPLRHLLTLRLQNNDNRTEGSYPEDAIAKLHSLQELSMDTFKNTTFGHGFSQLFNLKRLLLGFVNCNLASLGNDSFQVFGNISIDTLNLEYCPITTIARCAFSPLKSIADLNLSNLIYLAPTTALTSMYGLGGRKMRAIKINSIFQLLQLKERSMTDRVLTAEVMKNLENVCVLRFELINSKITWIDELFFKKHSRFTECIQFFDMSKNDIMGNPMIILRLSIMPRLVALDVSKNKGIIRLMQNVCSSKTHIVHYISVPRTLVSLNFSGFANNIGCVENVTFYNATSLTYLDISYFGIVGLGFQINGIANVSYINLSGNRLSGITSTFFLQFPKLETLIMSNVHVNDHLVASYDQAKILPIFLLRTIYLVDLSYNSFTILNTNIFSSLTLESLVLSNNRFKNIPFDLTTTPQLRYLDLRFNSISLLSQTDLVLLEDLASRNNLTLDLQDNILSCGCQNLDFISWLFNTHVHLSNGGIYPCLMDNGSLVNTSYIYNHMDMMWRICFGERCLAIAIATCSVLLLAIGGVYMFQIRKTYLLNILLRLFGFKALSQTRTRRSFAHDLYIGYCDQDYQYVCHTVKTILESRNLSLYLADRDSDPGNSIAHEIIRGIDSSWRSVVVLTSAFCDDSWCNFVGEYLVYTATVRPPGSLFIVLFEGVNRAEISPALLSVVEEPHIFDVSNYRGTRDLWNDVGQLVQLDAS